MGKISDDAINQDPLGQYEAERGEAITGEVKSHCPMHNLVYVGHTCPMCAKAKVETGGVKGLENYGPMKWCAIHYKDYRGDSCGLCENYISDKECIHGYLIDGGNCPTCNASEINAKQMMKTAMDQVEIDLVNNPLHYQSGGMEAIDVIEAFELPYHIGSAVKYLLRAGRKDSRLMDLQKASWYISREIARIELEETPDDASS